VNTKRQQPASDAIVSCILEYHQNYSDEAACCRQLNVLHYLYCVDGKVNMMRRVENIQNNAMFVQIISTVTT